MDIMFHYAFVQMNNFFYFLHHLHVFYVGLGCSEHILARVCSIIIKILHDLCLDGPIPQFGHQKSRLSGSFLSLFITDHLWQVGNLTLGALGSWLQEGQRLIALILFLLRLGSETEMETGMISVPDRGDVGRVLGRFLAKVDVGHLRDRMKCQNIL